jgi:branched-subunit amino acid transport protein
MTVDLSNRPLTTQKNRRQQQQSFKQFYAKYRELILFNKNIIVAAVVAIITDAIVVQYAAQSITNNVLVSIFSIITDTGVYLVAFAGLFYIDNRKKYIDVVTGVRDSNRFKQDAKKLVTALGVSEVIYMIGKFTSIYLLLQSNVAPPYQVAVLATLVAGVFSTVTANLMIKAQKLF